MFVSKSAVAFSIRVWSNAVDTRPTDELAWRVGSRCDGGACVALATLGGVVLLRDSEDPHSMLALNCTTWREFLTRAKGGQFDQPQVAGLRIVIVGTHGTCYVRAIAAVA